MNLPTNQIDVWAKATDQDKLKALASLNSLPSRHTDTVEISEAGYFVALDGVTRYGLSEAVRAVLKGSLGHAFFPSPPELRMQCDKAMEWPERHRERQLREERYHRERRENNAIVQRSPEAIARQQAVYRQFLAGCDDGGQQAAEDADRAEIRARYGLTDEAVASIPDQPVPSNFKKLA
jgi:hypothetical protein